MFRSGYDHDIATFDPQGRVHQIEYAMESLKLGSIAVGARSSTHVVLGGIKKASDTLTQPQSKIFEIDRHLGIAIVGLAADGRILRRWLRSECASHRYVYRSDHPVRRLCNNLIETAQKRTQFYGKRPYGAGLLIAGVDSTGPRLTEFVPSGNCFEYSGTSLGPRSQAARAELERVVDDLDGCDAQTLIRHVVRALAKARGSSRMRPETVEIAIVGREPNGQLEPFRVLTDEEVKVHLDALEAEHPEFFEESSEDDLD